MLQRLELDRDELAVALRHGVEREGGKDEAQLVDIQAIATPISELPHLRLPSSQDNARPGTNDASHRVMFATSTAIGEMSTP